MRKHSIVSVKSHYGEFRAFENDLITRQLREFGAHTRNEIAFLLNVTNEGDRIIDLGGHIGTFAVPLAKAVGSGGRVVAVEPDIRHYELLSSNINANGVSDRCVALRGLISQHSGVYLPHRKGGNTGATYFVKEQGQSDEHRTNKVQTSEERGAETSPADDSTNWEMHPPVFTLDQITSAFFPKVGIDVIKIDVEGMELSVLQSGARAIESNRPVLYIEIAKISLARQKHSIDDIDDFLRLLNYRYFVNSGERNSSHDLFEPKELTRLKDGGDFFDVLAIPDGSERMHRM